jgi:hypothetical protein
MTNSASWALGPFPGDPRVVSEKFSILLERELNTAKELLGDVAGIASRYGPGLSERERKTVSDAIKVSRRTLSDTAVSLLL